MKSALEIQAEFDRIALAEPAEGWNHNNHYHGFLLRHAPSRCADSLEVGCGTGALARLLAARSQHVLALDLSPEMVRIAQEQSAAYPHIDYVQADVMDYALLPEHFDCIASVATLHHLPLRDVLARLKAALKPGGVLLVLDLYRNAGLADWLPGIIAVPYHLALSHLKGRGNPPSAEAAAAWQAHGKDDHYLSISEVRRAAAELLPGARVTRHLLWRYSLIWTKPSTGRNHD